MKPLDLLAVGELNADLILEAQGPLPALGEERLCRSAALMLGSSTAICACVGASLGLRTAFFGRLGQDPFGKVCRETLRRYGVDDSCVSPVRGDTGITVSISYRRDRALITAPGATVDAFSADEVPRALLSDCRHLHVGSYYMNTRLAAGLAALFAAARARGATTSLDVGWDPSERWDGHLREVLRVTDLFFPNEGEVCAIGRSGDCRRAADSVLAHLPRGGILAVKRGGDGCLIARGPQRLLLPAFAVPAVDTTGAGDSFNAGFLAAHLKGEEDLERCGRYACAAAAVSVTRRGGTEECPRREDVELLLRQG